ncbi:MAG: DUF494 family protein [Chlorobiota bacterium]
MGAIIAWLAEMLDNPYVFRNHRRFAAYGVNRIGRMGFSQAEAIQALSWLPHLQHHSLILRRPPARKSSFRPLYTEETGLFSSDGFQHLMHIYSLQLLSVHQLEQLLSHIREEDLAPVDTETLRELLYELFPIYSPRGTPFYGALPNSERPQ